MGTDNFDKYIKEANDRLNNGFNRKQHMNDSSPLLITREIFASHLRREELGNGATAYAKRDLEGMFAKIGITQDDPRVSNFFDILQNKAHNGDGVEKVHIEYSYETGRGYRFDEEGFLMRMSTLEETLLKAGFSEKELVKKPFTQDELVSIVAKMVRSQEEDGPKLDKFLELLENKTNMEEIKRYSNGAQSDVMAVMTEHSLKNIFREAGFSEQMIAEGFSKSTETPQMTDGFSDKKVQQSKKGDTLYMNKQPKTGMEPGDLRDTVEDLQKKGYNNTDIMTALGAFTKDFTDPDFDIWSELKTKKQANCYDEFLKKTETILNYGKTFANENWFKEIINVANSIYNELKMNNGIDANNQSIQQEQSRNNQMQIQQSVLLKNRTR